MNETNFNWKKVNIKTNSVFDGTQNTGGGTSRIMSDFDNEEDGIPTIEKTIYIVKPLYVPIQVGNATEGKLTKISKTTRNKQQKAIYMQRPKPPTYNQREAGDIPTMDSPKRSPRRHKKKKFKNRSPLNVPSIMDDGYGMHDKNSDLRVTEQNTSIENSKRKTPTPDIQPVSMQPPKGPKDLKRILKSCKVIDEIFSKHTSKI